MGASLLLKLLIIGLSTADSLGGLFILTALSVEPIVDYLYPKRPDLYEEMKDLKAVINVETEKINEIQRTLTALQLNSVRR